MSETCCIRVEALTKRFGAITAVDGVSFDVSEGECFGFLGPNGAGKTTLIRMLTTLIKPTGGTAVVSGFDVLKHPDSVRQNIGVVPQAMTSDLDLTGYENMDIYGRFYGIPKKERTERIKYLLDIVGLSARASDLVAAYSGGMRRRLEIARAMVHMPNILFLDEPTIGLDPQSRHVVWKFLEDFRKGGSMSIFLTTHYMEEAETLSDRVVIIDAGKIIALGTPAELKAGIPGNDIISISVEKVTDALIERIKALPFVYKVNAEDNSLRIYVENGAHNLPQVIEEAKLQGKVISATIHEQSLEDVFIHYTGKSIREEEARKVSFLVGAGIPRTLAR